MKIKTEKKSIPEYFKLYLSTRESITDGVFAFGDKLPSKRACAEQNGVSVVTVEHAYSLLCDEGYIEAREKSGYFVIFNPDSTFSSVKDVQNEKKLTVPENGEDLPEFPFSVFTKKMRKVTNDYAEAILGRSPNTGCGELKTAIKNYLARNRGIIADEKQIIIGSGAEYLYGLVVKTLGVDRVYGIEEPSYEMIEQVYRSAGVKYEMLKLEKDGINSSALKKCSADILHITPYRSFPSGVTASASKRHEYLRWAEKNGKFLVEDDFESEFSLSYKPMETLFAMSENDNVIYINTFSKTVSPSLRTGYLILPECLVDAFYENAGFFSCTVPTFVQLVLAEIISGGDLERHINRVRRKKRNEEKSI